MTANCDYPVVEINIPVTKKGKCNLLVDSGADISLLKIHRVNEDTIIAVNKAVKIKGITSEEVKTYGLIEADMILDDGKIIKHLFQIVSKDFPLKQDGLIGRDFLRKNEVKMDFGINRVEIPGINGTPIIISMDKPGLQRVKKGKIEQNGISNQNKIFLEKFCQTEFGELGTVEMNSMCEQERDVMGIKDENKGNITGFCSPKRVKIGIMQLHLIMF